MASFSPAAESSSQAIVFADQVRWLVVVACLYVVLVVATVLTLHPYFAQTWDVVTFINAGKSIFSPGWNLLYAQSRAGSYWPYAYPPLHAFVVAPWVALAGFVPDYLRVRMAPLLFDIGLGILLFVVVAYKTQNKNLARLAMLVWLFNPVTWYDTAVQGHFEAEWLFFVVLGYGLFETKRHWLVPTLALSVAFLFKQNAILFALPLWAQMYFANDEKNRMRRLVSVTASMVVYAIPIVVVSLPFLLASNDYWYMNVQYVADVPLQTQSWLVALSNGFGAANLILRLSSILTLIATGLISLVAARRKMGLWLMGLLVVLAFFLLSKKVVGYYYVMIVPFAIVSLVPTKHYRLLSLILVAIAFISLSPYFASWANQAHGWLYGALGILNSVLWLGILVWVWRNHPLAVQSAQNERVPLFLTLALGLSAVSAALVQPFMNSQTSPIRAPLVAPGMEAQAFWVLVGFAVLVGIALVAAALYSRSFARTLPIPAGMVALVVLLTPLYFLTFTLTKESTAALESALKFLGL